MRPRQNSRSSRFSLVTNGLRSKLLASTILILLLCFENCETPQTAEDPGPKTARAVVGPQTTIVQAPVVSGTANANVRDFGALGNGTNDDSAAFKNAIAALAPGGILFIPQGRYLISETLSVSTAISINGEGVGSQIFESANVTLFSFQGAQAITISNLYLGSAATAPGTSLIRMTNSHRNRVVNVTMLGGHYGLYLHGSLLNTIEDLRSGVNFGQFFAATSGNQYWVYADAFNGISANGNTFVAPVLEGGVNGIYITDPGGQGSLSVVGGTIEGVTGNGITFQNTFLPSTISGLHMEANRLADILIADSSNIRLNSILALTSVIMTESSPGRSPRNVSISDSTVERITIPANAKRIRLTNLTTCISGATNGSGITNNVPPNAVNTFDGTPSVIMSQIGPYCLGQ